MQRPGFNQTKLCRHLMRRYPRHAGHPLALISVAGQCLYLVDRLKLIACYSISTSRYGTGMLQGSMKTPTGTHCIASKIGQGEPLMTVFVARRATGRIACVNQTSATGVDDVISSRILWLNGLEIGHNRGGQSDSMQRYIYIHGTPDEKHIGKPVSHGCIRMKNNDICKLFEVVKEGSLVHILTAEEERAYA